MILQLLSVKDKESEVIVTVSAAAPIKMLSAPASFMVTFPVAVKSVKVATPGVPPPMVPGAAKVAPFKEEAFRLATLVVEATEKGAVPVARVEVNCPERLRVVMPLKAPAEVMTKEGELRKFL